MDNKAFNKFLFAFVSIILILFVVTFVTGHPSNDTISIDGYLCYYYYGYRDDILTFEICTSTEIKGKGDKTYYILNPSVSKSFFKYNSVDSKVDFIIYKKNIYDIRR